MKILNIKYRPSEHPKHPKHKNQHLEAREAPKNKPNFPYSLVVLIPLPPRNLKNSTRKRLFHVEKVQTFYLPKL